MSDYPRAGMLRSSTATPVSGFDAERSTSGRLYVRQMYPDDKLDFEIRHALSQGQWNDLRNFYNEYRYADVSLYWPPDGVIYIVRFTAAPQPVKFTHHWEVSVKLQQV